MASEELQDSSYCDNAWWILADWIANNPLGDRHAPDTAWHPYCISRRLPVWMLLWSASPVPAELSTPLRRSMYLQARYLEDHLEWDLGGNHLLENIAALALAGCFFEGRDATRWLRKSERLLRRELAEQILPHGEHYERSPGYHCRVMEILLDVYESTRRVAPSMASLCEAPLERMAGFLADILHPDEDIPLFGDSCLDEASGPRSLIDSVRCAIGSQKTPGTSLPTRAAGPTAKTVGEYWVWRHERDFLIFDAGPVGVDHLPAHAHSDLLTLEASLNGKRLFVDTGNFDYDDGPFRQHCRSMAAHNVSQIDGAEQCDVWSHFRMGRRGRPSRLTTGQAKGFDWAWATHDAYGFLDAPVTGRWLACRPRGPWFCVDWVRGAGVRTLTTRLHLHPDSEVMPSEEGQLRIRHAESTLQLIFLSPGEVNVRPCWYCPGFGIRRESKVIEWTTTARLPIATGWALAFGERDIKATISSQRDESIILSWSEHETTESWTLPLPQGESFA